ncbi:hypothetical protein C8K44_13428 [Aminobacter sp. AP02]|nr:hypothetical protein C8K44_13428 [Aminobacter sp. AP02]
MMSRAADAERGKLVGNGPDASRNRLSFTIAGRPPPR